LLNEFENKINFKAENVLNEVICFRIVKNSFKWKVIEKRIKEMIKYPDKIFPQMTFK